MQNGTPYDPDSAFSRAKLAAELVTALEAAGFERDPKSRGEISYRRKVTTKAGDLPSTHVVIYTTIPVEGPLEVRELGKDAIRTVAIFKVDGKSGRCLAKTRRVFRTGMVESIVARAIERARVAWRDALERPRCQQCGAPTFRSRKDNNVCAAVCWANDGK